MYTRQVSSLELLILVILLSYPTGKHQSGQCRPQLSQTTLLMLQSFLFTRLRGASPPLNHPQYIILDRKEIKNQDPWDMKYPENPDPLGLKDCNSKEVEKWWEADCSRVYRSGI